jgi:hypothetical protein
VASFPYVYLGLPHNIRKPSHASLQPLVQKVGSRLLGWKKDLLSYPGRELLVKSILTSIPTHYLIVFKLPKWAIAGIKKFRKSFLWKGFDP